LFATVNDLLDPTLFAAVIADRRFAAAAAIALVSGAARGFSGFGSAMIYIPLVAAVYDPRIAAATMVLIDLVCAFPLAVRAVPQCNGREVIPISIAAAAAVPVGAWLLLVADPVMLRWVIAGVVIVLLAVVASGWRYHGKARLPATIGVGLLSGLGSGAVQIAGPPVIIYWLGGAGQAAFVRANLMVYFTFIDVIGVVTYADRGLFTREVAVLSLLLGPPFVIAMVAGAYWFRSASERSFRLVAYAIIAVSALASLPIFDRFLR
jgi:uncharacterized membrane protein YfcA